jgi:hypothetical protein
MENDFLNPWASIINIYNNNGKMWRCQIKRNKTKDCFFVRRKNLIFCDKRIFDSQVCSKLMVKSLPIPTGDVELDEYLGWKTIFSILGRP